MNFGKILTEMLTNESVKMFKHDDASLMRLIENVSVKDTIDNDVKALII